MLKYYLTIFLSVLLLPSITFAANDDVSISGSTVLTVGSYDLVVSGTANIDSIAVSSDSFSLVLSKGASITVASADRRSYTVSPNDYIDSFSCLADSSTLVVTNDIWDTAVTVTVTPSSDACGVASSGGGGGSSGGGGGGGGSVPTPVYTVIPGTAETTTTESTTGTSTTGQQTQAQTQTQAQVSATFTNTMRLGMSSADIKRLQQLLNSDPDTMIAASGVGSPGNETEYFGGLTEKAVQKFQEKYSLASAGDAGYGYVGPKTRAKLQEVFGEQAQTQSQTQTGTQTQTSTQTQSQADTLQAQIQQMLEQVEALQAQLNTVQ